VGRYSRLVNGSARLGVLGCGWIARHVHLPVLGRRRDVEVVAVCDVNEDVRRTAADLAPEATPYRDPLEALEDPRLDGVVIATPPGTHADLAVAAFERGLHVYLEKPVATNLEEGIRLLRAWRNVGTVGMPGLNYRFAPRAAALRADVREGRAGRPLLVRTVFTVARLPRGGWRDARAGGGGVLLDLASHHVDLVRFVLDAEVESARARIWSHRAEDDCATLNLTLDDGTPVHSFFSSATAEEDVIEICGDRAKLTLDRYRSDRIELTSANPLRSRLERLRAALPGPAMLRKIREPLREPSFRIALERFVRAIRDGDDPGVDLEDGVRALAVIDAAERSARGGGRPTPVPSLAGNAA